jgi:hypothetical protein
VNELTLMVVWPSAPIDELNTGPVSADTTVLLFADIAAAAANPGR